jgi:hypothetical protein
MPLKACAPKNQEAKRKKKKGKRTCDVRRYLDPPQNSESHYYQVERQNLLCRAVPSNLGLLKTHRRESCLVVKATSNVFRSHVRFIEPYGCLITIVRLRDARRQMNSVFCNI